MQDLSAEISTLFAARVEILARMPSGDLAARSQIIFHNAFSPLLTIRQQISRPEVNTRLVGALARRAIMHLANYCSDELVEHADQFRQSVAEPNLSENDLALLGLTVIRAPDENLAVTKLVREFTPATRASSRIFSAS